MGGERGFRQRQRQRDGVQLPERHHICSEYDTLSLRVGGDLLHWNLLSKLV